MADVPLFVCGGAAGGRWAGIVVRASDVVLTLLGTSR